VVGRGVAWAVGREAPTRSDTRSILRAGTSRSSARARRSHWSAACSCCVGRGPRSPGTKQRSMHDQRPTFPRSAKAVMDQSKLSAQARRSLGERLLELDEERIRRLENELAVHQPGGKAPLPARCSAEPGGPTPQRPPRRTDGPAGTHTLPTSRMASVTPRDRNRAVRVASGVAISELSATILGPS